MNKIKVFFLLFAVLCINACKNKDIERCENFFSKKTYMAKETCSCLKKQADANNVNNFGEFVTYIESNLSAPEDFISSMLSYKLKGGTGKKTETFLATLEDSLNICHLADDQIPDRVLTTDFSGNFTSMKDNKILCVTYAKVDLDENKEIWHKYLYRKLDFTNLLDFIYDNTKNVNFLKFYDEVRSVNMETAYENWFKNDNNLIVKETIEDTKGQHIEEVKELLKLILLTSFNNTFGTAFMYYKDEHHKSTQAAIDLAYMDSYQTLMLILLGKLPNYLPTLKSFNMEQAKLYQENPQNKNLCTMLAAYEHQEKINNIINELKKQE